MFEQASAPIRIAVLVGILFTMALTTSAPLAAPPAKTAVPTAASPGAPAKPVMPPPLLPGSESAAGSAAGAAGAAAASAGLTPGAGVGTSVGTSAGSGVTTTPLAAPGNGPHWAYEGDAGPADWATLAPDFALCGSGNRQSPIDIREGIKVDLEPINFEYRDSAFRVIDNGHTVQVNMGSGNAIRVMGKRFNLVQFHFHHPAEELIDGHAAEMVVHLVHKDADGKLAVIAVLLEAGQAQPEIQNVWNNLPLERNEEVHATSRLNVLNLLPEDRRYYTYMGSLTTPPCTEGVLWMVMKTPVQVSAEQIALFSRLYPMNARPVQATAGRMIKESN